MASVTVGNKLEEGDAPVTLNRWGTRPPFREETLSGMPGDRRMLADSVTRDKCACVHRQDESTSSH